MNARSQSLVVLNWQMHLTYQEEVDFATRHYDALEKISEKTNNSKIIISPSFLSIYPLSKIFAQTPNIRIGSQGVSEHLVGSHNGHISAESLNEAGCSYAIVELHDHYCAKKVAHIINCDLQPIIIIDDLALKKPSKAKLKKMIEELIGEVNNLAPSKGYHGFCVAYTPAATPESEMDFAALESTLAWLQDMCYAALPKTRNFILYRHKSATLPDNYFKHIRTSNGLFLEESSINFSELEKVVHLIYTAE